MRIPVPVWSVWWCIGDFGDVMVTPCRVKGACRGRVVHSIGVVHRRGAILSC